MNIIQEHALSLTVGWVDNVGCLLVWNIFTVKPCKSLSLRAEKLVMDVGVSVMYSNTCEVAMKKTPNKLQEER